MTRGKKNFYYIDKSKLANILIFLLSSICNIKIQKLDFELRKIKTKKGELRRFVINRQTSFDIIKQIVNRICQQLDLP